MTIAKTDPPQHNNIVGYYDVIAAKIEQVKKIMHCSIFHKLQLLIDNPVTIMSL